MSWVIFGLAIAILTVFTSVIISFAWYVLYDKDMVKRNMGAISVSKRKLNQSNKPFEAMLTANEEESYKLDPIEGFVFADLVDDRVIEYGLAIGYAPSFLTTPIKQVSYVLYQEELGDDDMLESSKSKITARQKLVFNMDAKSKTLLNSKSVFSSVDMKTPCVLPRAYKYLLT